MDKTVEKTVAASTDTKQPSTIKEALMTIESLKELHMTPTSVFEALKVRYDWPSGLEMTSAKYQEQFKIWLEEPCQPMKGDPNGTAQ